ncbi:unnamed protein product [Clonostachys solani]|uniref:Uncharacterized protein n=1 Tax=Clonostachys solani TaxID=160281 RepID=A0A9N9Z8I7_9HYPO|nr:unnamed protein product [Clonostachys solani]
MPPVRLANMPPSSRPALDDPRVQRISLNFLPHISRDPKDVKTSGVLGDDPDLCKELTRSLHLPPFFLQHKAWDSNGFLITRHVAHPEGHELQSCSGRFLIKVVTQANNKWTYSWQFLSFSILWAKNLKDNKVSCVVVCYDDCHELEDKISDALKKYSPADIKDNPLAIYDAFLQVVIWEYDSALWGFREPVRNIEKAREGFIEDVIAIEMKGESEKITKKYTNMHELSRHSIHMSETLQAASKTVEETLRDIETRLMSPGSGLGLATMNTRNIVAGIRFSNVFLNNLKLRSDAFVARLENEIQMAYNMVSVYQLKESNESTGLTKFVTHLTLFFLPFTFVAGFWGMNFTQLDNDRKMYVSTDIWMFVVTGFGSTLAAFIVLYYRRIANTTKTLYNKVTPAPVRRPTFRLGNQFTWDIGRKESA